MSSDWICGVCFDINFARNKTCRWGCDTINPTLPEDEVNALEAGIGLDDGGAGGGGAQASPGGGPQDAGGGNFGNNFGGGGGHQHGGGGGQQGGEKPRGRGGPTVIPGDWICPGCGDLQFARNYSCRICSTPKPPNAGMEDLSKGKGKNKGGKDKGGKGGKDKGGYGGGKGGYGGGKQDNGFGGGGYGGGKQDNGFGGGGYGGGKQDNGFGGGYGGGKQDNGFGGGKDFYGGGKQDNNNFGGQQQQQQFGGPQDNNNFGGQQQQQPDPFAGMIGELPQPGVGDMPKPDMGVFAGGDAQAGGAPSMDPGSFSRNLLATIITTGQDNSPDWKTLWQDFCTLQNSTNQNPNKHSEVFLRQFLASNVHTFAEETWLQESKDVLMSMGINLDSGEVRLTPDQPENPAVEEFIRDNGFDDNASESLRGLSAEEQQAIMGRGGVKDFPNPSAVLLMRIKELADSRAGGGKGANKENVWGGNGGAPGGNNMFGKGGAQKMQGQAGANRFAPY